MGSKDVASGSARDEERRTVLFLESGEYMESGTCIGSEFTLTEFVTWIPRSARLMASI